MSEAATHSVTAPIARPELLASLDPLLREWLPRQRWFAGKGRPVTGFSLVAAVELLPATAPLGLLHLLVRAHQPLTPAQGAVTHPGDCYQLLIGVREALPPRLAPALIGHLEEGPLAGRTVYEALYDPRPADVLLEALRTRARIGELRFERDRHQEIRDDLVPRLVTSEQSNSSIVYGDTFILKLLRRIVPGINPDLELPLTLAREGCARVPAPTGWLVTDLGEETYVLGVLQPFVRGAADGWELALRELAKRDGLGGPEDCGGFDRFDGAGGFEGTGGFDGAGGSDRFDGAGGLDRFDGAGGFDGLGGFGGEVRALGRATAEVHTALAHALPTVTLGHAQMGTLVDGMTERLEVAAQAVPALRPYAPGLRTAFAALADLAAEGHTWTAQRIHGDLHLGQCLRSPSGEWSLIDFEGEPSKPLAERRMPQPPARDIAGMLRSFDYAARSQRPPVPGWADACRAAYCTGYAEVTGVDPRTDPVLLRAYETDKAVYEVLYEARHRPDWLPVPMAAVRRLAASP
ncbi:maltokinase [Streptomyces sp. NPDC058251]|uniref:maltokinase N-terminal cap-like domain-containing protein n=1 Tax=Streptomyces sp. NPDC058251 TaxID=3346404 RepID=UPI0036E3BBFB